MLPFIADMPPLEQERVVCSISAAMTYEVPTHIVLAIAEKEGGKPGQRVRNSNGTYDVGSMQFNTAYLGDLKKYGITEDDVAAPGCYAFDLAAWRLRGHILYDSGDIWTKAANYHSRTPKYNAIYRADLKKKAIKWSNWLNKHFATVNVIAHGSASNVNGIAAEQVIQKAAKIADDSAHKQSIRQGKIRYSPNQQTGYMPRTITFQGSRAK